MNWYVYALYDPRCLSVRYIGRTTGVSRRLRQHLYDGSNTHKRRWIDSLLRQGVRPEIFILEYGDGDGWRESEIRWIADFRSTGARLTNATDGGDGVLGHKWTEQQRQNFISKMTGRGLSKKASPDTIKRLSDSHIGQPGYWTGKHLSEETRRKLSEANKGKGKGRPSPNKGKPSGNKGKPTGIAPWNKGKTIPIEARKKMSLAKKGKPRRPFTAEVNLRIAASMRKVWEQRKKEK